MSEIAMLQQGASRGAILEIVLLDHGPPFAQRCLGKDEADLGSLGVESCGAPAETRA